MLTDITRALLGDREAAERLTEQGVLIPCPICGAEIDRRTVKAVCMLSEFRPGRWNFMHFCNEENNNITIYGESEAEVIMGWNTRAPILSAEEMERLEATNEHDAS